MKSALIVHGWDGSPKEAMLQWIKDELEKRKYEVIVPAMPDPAVPTIDAWIGRLKEVALKEGERTFVGHSIGCQAILRYIEVLNENEKINKVILIAPWVELDMKIIEEEGKEIIKIAKPWMETSIDFKKVKSHVKRFVAIFSDNDPYVLLSQKDLFEKKLGAEIIVEHDKGHFTESDGVKDLPAIIPILNN